MTAPERAFDANVGAFTSEEVHLSTDIEPDMSDMDKAVRWQFQLFTPHKFHFCGFQLNQKITEIQVFQSDKFLLIKIVADLETWNRRLEEIVLNDIESRKYTSRWNYCWSAMRMNV